MNPIRCRCSNRGIGIANALFIGCLVLAGTATAQNLPTRLVSVTDQQSSANDRSELGVITPDAGAVVFTSAATDLTADAGAAAPFQNIYWRDLATGTTSRVSQALSGAPDGHSAAPGVSDTGLWVVFQSAASNLTLADANGVTDIFALNRISGLTTLLSINQFGSFANGDSVQPVISGNGRHVLFLSRADNLDPGSGISRPYLDLFALDRDPDGNGTLDEPGTLQPVRLVQSAAGLAGSPAFAGYQLSGDGRFVVFSSAYTGLTADPVTATYNLYFHDRDADANGIFDESGGVQTTLLVKAGDGSALTAGASQPSLSRDALRVAFVSQAAELNAGCDPQDCAVKVLELDADATTGVPDPSSTTLLAALTGLQPRLSAAGSQLTRTVGSGADLLLRDLATGVERSICLSATQRAGNRGCAAGLASDDGVLTVFASASSNLVPLDANAAVDLFVADTNGVADTSPPLAACDDQLDNDGNGMIDLDDPGCYAPEDNDELVGATVRLVPVTTAPEQSGAFTVLDAQGFAGFNPDLATTAAGLRHAVYEVTQNNNPGRVRQVRLATFDQNATLIQEVGLGEFATVKTDPGGQPHIAYLADNLGQIVYKAGPQGSAQTLPASNCESGKSTFIHDLAIDSQNQPRIGYFETCGSSVWIWRPRVGVQQISLSTSFDVHPLSMDITPLDETILTYVDNILGDEELVLVRTDSSDGAVSEIRVPVPRTNVDLEIRSDVMGLAHIAYTPLVGSDNPVTGVMENPSLIYLREQDGQLLRSEFFLPAAHPLGYAVAVSFSADGFTPRFLLTSERDPMKLRHVQWNGSELVEVAPPAYKGRPSAISVAETDPGQAEFVYHELETGNAIHVDPDAAPWRFSAVSSEPNAELRDLAFSLDALDNVSPVLATFTSLFSGGVGELIVHRRDTLAGAWTRASVAVAIPQDAVSLAATGTELVHFDNQSQRLNHYQETQPGVWQLSGEITALSGFDSLDHVSFAGDSSSTSPPVVMATLRTGEGAQLMAYVKDPISGNWQGFPFASNPTVFVNSAASAMYPDEGLGTTAVTAYSDAAASSLRLASFDVRLKTWTDEPVDSDTSGAVIGNFISLQLTRELLFGGRSSARVPTIVYDVNSRQGLRYASRQNAWTIWQYDRPIPEGVQINGVSHQLENASRLRPVVAETWSNGQVQVLSRVSGGDEMAAPASIASLVATDHRGQGAVRLGLAVGTYVSYATQAGETTYAAGQAQGGLPLAGSTGPPTRPNENGRGASLDPELCGFYIRSGERNPAKTRHSPAKLSSDEPILGQWGDLFARSAAGQRYIDFYADSYPKMARLAASDPGLLYDGIATLQNFMPGIRAMVGGFGDQVFLTQQMVDDGLDIWQRLSDRDSGELSAFIEIELASWNNMQDFVGMSFDEWGTTIGLIVGAASPGDQLFADSFEN